MCRRCVLTVRLFWCRVNNHQLNNDFDGLSRTINKEESIINAQMPRSDVTATNPKVALVTLSYKVRGDILGIITLIGAEVDRIYVVDDRCPEG